MAIVIMGAGGHGKVILDLVQEIYKDSEHKYYIYFVDNDPKLVGTYIHGKEVLPKSKICNVDMMAIAIGNNDKRKLIYEEMKQKGYNMPTLIHPKTYIAQSAAIGDGTQICVGTIIQTGVRIGECCIINTGAKIDHDCKIGDYSFIAPGVILCGSVEVGSNTFVAAGSVIRPGIKIGNNCFVKMGSVITKDLPNGSVFPGRKPKKFFLF